MERDISIWRDFLRERKALLGEMKLSTKVLTVIDKNFNQMDDELLQEASAHLN